MPLIAAWPLLLTPLREARIASLPRAVLQDPDLSQPRFTTDRLRNLRMRTRDGVTLVADAVRPLDRGRFPVILERTPLGREASLASAEYWASRGYVYVAQDSRGRGDSGGTWNPFTNEGRDGYDAIAWVARQPWCDGNVGTIGDGYAATAQWLAAAERPPALCCVVPRFASPVVPYENGVFSLAESLRWAGLGLDKRTVPSDSLINPDRLSRLPLSDLDRSVLGRTSSIYQAWLRGTRAEEIDFAQVSVPLLQVSGWSDPNGIGTKLPWEAMRRGGLKDHWLVYGPWSAGDDVPSEASGPAGLTLRFFDTYLKGQSVGLETVPRVQAFVTGANRWLSLDDWPTTTIAFETLYLAPKRMVSEAGEQGAAVYVYDPAKDVRVTDGAVPAKVTLPPAGSFALFVADPTPKPKAIAGPFEVRLFFKTSAGDTDFFATLVDQAPDGALRRIGQAGKVRASYRNGPDRVDPLKSGRIYAATLRPWDAAYEIAKGHRLGLLVNSSMFPRYARNLGTGEPVATAKQPVPQRNAILTGRVTPSRITFRRLW